MCIMPKISFFRSGNENNILFFHVRKDFLYLYQKYPCVTLKGRLSVFQFDVLLLNCLERSLADNLVVGSSERKRILISIF